VHVQGGGDVAETAAKAFIAGKAAKAASAAQSS